MSGLLAAFAFSESNAFAIIIVAVCLGLTAVFACIHCSAKQMLAAVFGVLLSCATWTIYNSMVRKPLLAYDGQNIVCSAKITDLRYYSSDTIRYTLRTKLNGIPTQAEWYASAEIPQMQIGDELTLNATFSRISDDFPYHSAKYAAGQGRYLRITKAEDIKITKQGSFSIKQKLRNYREHITNCIRAELSSDEEGLLLAMLFGDKNALSDDTSASLYRTGVGHITAVSGLHLVFFCTLLSALLRKLRTSAQMRFIAIIIASAVFSIMVDSAVSVYRAALMLLLAQSAELFGRRADTLRSLCLAMLCCTIFTPYVVGAASFWLSVSGVLGVGVLSPWMTEQIRLPRKKSAFFPLASLGVKLLELLCVSIAVFPASVILCGESSLFSPIGNLIILPFAIAALYIGLLVACTGGLLAFLLPIAGIFCRIATFLAKYIAKLPYSHIQIGEDTVKITLFCCAIFVLLIICCTKRRTPTIFSVMLCTMILTLQLAYEQHLTNHQLRIAVVGTEKYNAAIVSFGGHTAVFDDSNRALSASYVQSYLEINGISSFDVLSCRPQTIAAYNNAFPKVGAVYITDTSYLRENQTICGCIPISSENTTPTLISDETEISASNEILHIRWQEQDLDILKNNYIGELISINESLNFNVSTIR